MTDEQGMINMPRGNVQDLFDIVVGSLDFGSGFLYQEQIEMLRAVAVTLGVDPMTATPGEYAKSYPHPFKPLGRVWPPRLETCYYCSSVEFSPWHTS